MSRVLVFKKVIYERQLGQICLQAIAGKRVDWQLFSLRHSHVLEIWASYSDYV